MKRTIPALLVAVLLLSAAAALAGAGSAPPGTTKGFNEAEASRLLGAPGQVEDGAYVVLVPRRDLTVKVGGQTLLPSQGIASEFRFSREGSPTVAMADLCLTEAQVNAVLDVVLREKLTVTALHDHYSFEQPALRFMHLMTSGEENDVMRALAAVQDEVKRSAGATPPSVPVSPASTTLDVPTLNRTLGVTGKMDHGAYVADFTPGTVKIGRFTLGKGLEIESEILMVGTMSQAWVNAEIVVTENDLQTTLAELRKGSFLISEIHNHQIEESPHLLYVHCMGVGAAQAMAQNLRTVLDFTKSEWGRAPR